MNDDMNNSNNDDTHNDMTDELKKLAEEMQIIRPSTSARQLGMSAAMAAFQKEFEVEAVSETQADLEKNTAAAQGSTKTPRLTEQTTRTGRVQSFGSRIMGTVKSRFSINPKAAMMLGSCAAAMMFAFIIVPNSTDEFISPPKGVPATDVVIAEDRDDITPVIGVITDAKVPNEADGLDEIVVTGSRQVRDRAESPNPAPVPVITQPEAEIAVAPPPPSSIRQGGITSVNGLLSKVQTDSSRVESEKKARQRFFFNSNSYGASQGAAPNAPLELNGNEAGFTGPMVEKTVTRQVVKTPAMTTERTRPSITKTETRRIEQTDGSFKTVTETVVVQEASTELVTVPPVYETITETIMVPEGSGDQFESFISNPVTSVIETPVSTFSIDVDTASYSFLRASINRGQLPPPSSIRLEEMINYFPYDYAAPTSAREPFKANVTVTPTPWNADTKLMHIGIKGYVPKPAERPNSNITLLIDTSGSMRAQNKLPLLINSFKLLLNTLDEDDTISIVTYAGSAGTVLEPTPASDKNKILQALTNLRAGGSTAGAAGLELAYMKAAERFDKDGVNRVILATDGDFNVGFSSPDEMKTYITEKRKSGIFLSVLGFGAGNYNDQLMQTLAQNGNGVAAYIDSLSEANKVLADEAGSALFTIAKDVKIQVEFNPDTISEYRLIGYETRALNREDFNNDKVDAGEIGAGHSVTAIYELTPAGSPAEIFDKLRYAKDSARDKAAGADEYAFVKIRHKLPNADKSTLQTFPIGPDQERGLNRASEDMKFAAAVAAVGQKLRGDTHLEDYSYQKAIELASDGRGEDRFGYRAEFIQLVRLIDNLTK